MIQKDLRIKGGVHMIKVTKATEVISTVGQSSIKAGVKSCDDICSDGCVINCKGSGTLTIDTAANWLFEGIWPDDQTS